MKRFRPSRKTVAVLVCAAVVLAAARTVQLVHQLRPRDIPVLMYHDVLDGGDLDVWQVSADEFVRQMDQLAEAGYETILPRDVERASRGWGWLPDKPVVITFDDGYEGVKEFAEPVLAARGFKAICYVIVDRLSGDGEPQTSSSGSTMLSTNEVAAMASRGTIAIGSHSLTHQPIPALLSEEIRKSRYAIRRITGIKTRDYCYPFGLHGYDHMYRALRESHYATAMICDDRLFRYGTDTNLLAIPRLSVYGGRHAIGVAAEDAAAGTVTVTNAGVELPLKAVVRRDSDGRTWEADARRVGGRRRAAVYGFPPEALAEPHRIEAWDKSGLFRYLP